MNTFRIDGHILRIEDTKAISNSWTILRQEIVVKTIDERLIVLTLEEHKRGLHMVTTFARIGYRLGSKISATCKLMGIEYQGKVTNRIIVTHFT